MSPQHAAPTETTRPHGSATRNLVVVAVLALVGALAAGPIGPNPRLGPAAAGDEALVADVGAIVGEGRGLTQLAVARLDGDRTDFAGFGDPVPTPDTPFELGSITKVFVGHVLADAVVRGDVALDDPLETHLPELAGTPAGGATLVSLATHTSGLRRLPEGMGGLQPALSPRDPYPAWNVGQLTDAARSAALERTGAAGLGMALLALLGPWHWLPGGVIGAFLGLFAGAAALTLGRAARAPWLPARHASGAIATLVVSVLLVAADVFLLV